jgi:hypothetical protein
LAIGFIHEFPATPALRSDRNIGHRLIELLQRCDYRIQLRPLLNQLVDESSKIHKAQPLSITNPNI